MRKYFLRNTTKLDINIGDLRYTIPAGQTRDLLSPRARLNIEDINNSKNNGSLRKKIETGMLVEVNKIIKLTPPKKTETKNVLRVVKNEKSSIKVDTEELNEQFNNMVLNDEDDFLKELEQGDSIVEAPLVHVNEPDET